MVPRLVVKIKKLDPLRGTPCATHSLSPNLGLIPPGAPLAKILHPYRTPTPWREDPTVPGPYSPQDKSNESKRGGGNRPKIIRKTLAALTRRLTHPRLWFFTFRFGRLAPREPPSTWWLSLRLLRNTRPRRHLPPWDTHPPTRFPTPTY